MRKIIVIAIALAVVMAVLFTACFGFDERPDIFAEGFIPVEEITGITTVGLPNRVIPLAGTVLPQDATIKKIEWSVKNAGGTDAVLNESKTGFTAFSDGAVTVNALIKDGRGSGKDYSQDFVIRISLSEVYAVEYIDGIPAALPIGDKTYTFNGRVSPVNAQYKEIVYSVKSAGGTGAVIDGNLLAATGPGTAVVTATVVNGLLEDGDYTQDFPIRITRSVIASGQFNRNSIDNACYWIDGELFELPATPVNPAVVSLNTTGVVLAGGKRYIAGYHGSVNTTANRTACYWEDDDYHKIGIDNNSETYSIAADGNYVYITGRDGGAAGQNSTGNFCYWKIDTTNGTVTKQALSLPTGATIDIVNSYRGFFAVKDGRVRIPFSTNSGTVRKFYWDENGTAIPIPEIDNYWGLASIAFVGNDVYIGGSAQGDDYYRGTPFYYILGSDAPKVFNYTVSYYSATINSIVEQNGSPVFYYFNYPQTSGACYWDAEGKRTALPAVYYYGAYIERYVFFVDDDVYICMQNGYMVLNGLNHRAVTDRSTYTSSAVTGIAVVRD